MTVRMQEKVHDDILPTVRIEEGKEVIENSEDEDDGGPPSHPIMVMQGPFEESISESGTSDALPPSVFPSKYTPKQRHQRLLDGHNYNDSYNARWRKNAKQSYHPLWKIAAQIVFGVHLLQQQLAKSDEEVVRILQRHVDEVDGFIQRTGEDFDATLADVRERINYLELPLQHAAVFDQMLEERQFRHQIIQGNELIEGVISRTAELLNDYLVDIQKGKESTKDMSAYLNQLDGDWPDGEGQGSYDIFKTMQANAEGWLECYANLQMRANRLGAALVQLGGILNEMQTRAGVASRRTSRPSSRAQSRQASRPGSSSSKRRKESMSGLKTPASRYARSLHKPLPEDPEESPRSARSIKSSHSRTELHNLHKMPSPPSWPPTGKSPVELPAEFNPAPSISVIVTGSDNLASPISSGIERPFLSELGLNSQSNLHAHKSAKDAKRSKSDSRRDQSLSSKGSSSGLREHASHKASPRSSPRIGAESLRSKAPSSTRKSPKLAQVDSAYDARGAAERTLSHRSTAPGERHSNPQRRSVSEPPRPTISSLDPALALEDALKKTDKLALLTGGLDSTTDITVRSRKLSTTSMPREEGVEKLTRRGSAPVRPSASMGKKSSLGNFALFKRWFGFKWRRGKRAKNGRKGMSELVELP